MSNVQRADVEKVVVKQIDKGIAVQADVVSTPTTQKAAAEKAAAEQLEKGTAIQAENISPALKELLLRRLLQSKMRRAPSCKLQVEDTSMPDTQRPAAEKAAAEQAEKGAAVQIEEVSMPTAHKAGCRAI